MSQPIHQPYPPAAAAPPTASPRSGGVAPILSFLIPGLGHLYTGNPVSAVVWFVSAALAWASLCVAIGVVLIPLVMAGAMIHAYISASNFNRRHNTMR